MTGREQVQQAFTPPALALGGALWEERDGFTGPERYAQLIAFLRLRAMGWTFRLHRLTDRVLVRRGAGKDAYVVGDDYCSCPARVDECCHRAAVRQLGGVRALRRLIVEEGK